MPVTTRPHPPYAVPIDELERSAHVPVEEQVEEQPAAPAVAPPAAEEVDRQRLLGPTAAGRLRL